MKSSKMKTRNSRRSSMPSYYTYLKPGALAQIRNSKITAKSRVIAMYQQKPNSDIQVSQAAAATAATPPTMEGIPCFNLKVKNNRPCCLQRKKLSAVAPVFYEPNHDPSLVTI